MAIAVSDVVTNYSYRFCNKTNYGLAACLQMRGNHESEKVAQNLWTRYLFPLKRRIISI